MKRRKLRRHFNESPAAAAERFEFSHRQFASFFGDLRREEENKCSKNNFLDLFSRGESGKSWYLLLLLDSLRRRRPRDSRNPIVRCGKTVQYSRSRQQCVAYMAIGPSTKIKERHNKKKAGRMEFE